MRSARKWFIADTKTCASCKQTFARGDRPRRWFARAIYCTRKCADRGKHGRPSPLKLPIVLKTCLTCGDIMPLASDASQRERQLYRKRKFCSTFCDNATGRKRVVGERYVNRWGYVRVVTEKGRDPYEHRLVAEKALGRKLKNYEQVHHINGDSTDNRNENLLICSNEYHRWLHNEMSRRYALEHFGPRYEPAVSMLDC